MTLSFVVVAVLVVVVCRLSLSLLLLLLLLLLLSLSLSFVIVAVVVVAADAVVVIVAVAVAATAELVLLLLRGLAPCCVPASCACKPCPPSRLWACRLCLLPQSCLWHVCHDGGHVMTAPHPRRQPRLHARFDRCRLDELDRAAAERHGLAKQHRGDTTLRCVPASCACKLCPPSGLWACLCLAVCFHCLRNSDSAFASCFHRPFMVKTLPLLPGLQVVLPRAVGVGTRWAGCTAGGESFDLVHHPARQEKRLPFCMTRRETADRLMVQHV